MNVIISLERPWRENRMRLVYFYDANIASRKSGQPGLYLGSIDELDLRRRTGSLSLWGGQSVVVDIWDNTGQPQQLTLSPAQARAIVEHLENS